MAEGTVLLNGHFHVPAARNHGSWHYTYYVDCATGEVYTH